MSPTTSCKPVLFPCWWVCEPAARGIPRYKGRYHASRSDCAQALPKIVFAYKHLPPLSVRSREAIKDALKIPDRVQEMRRVPARELLPKPKNGRAHPPAQQEALQGLLAEPGFGNATLAWQLADGRLQLPDGHLRCATTPDIEMPMLVLDVTEAEADKLPVSFDSLASLAEAPVTRSQRCWQLLPRERKTTPLLSDRLTSITNQTQRVLLFLLDIGVDGPEQQEPFATLPLLERC